MIPNYQSTLAFDAKARLAECPLWSVAEQALYWVDISGCTINRFKPATGVNVSWATLTEPGCIALAAKGGLMAAMRNGWYHLTTESGALTLIAAAPYNPAQFRFNDGRCDAAGRFWAGAMYEPRTSEDAAMYCLQNGESREAWGPQQNLGVKVSNGLAFSLDNKTVYQSDTPNHVIYRFPFDLATGKIGAREIFVKRPDDKTAADYSGRPDGAAIDSEGCYWSAQYEGSSVLRFSPAGEIIARVNVPARRVTMLAFGGQDLRTMYITTARDGATENELKLTPNAGAIFACKVDVAGLATPLYRD